MAGGFEGRYVRFAAHIKLDLDKTQPGVTEHLSLQDYGTSVDDNNVLNKAFATPSACQDR
jgi:hypothetical protein